MPNFLTDLIMKIIMHCNVFQAGKALRVTFKTTDRTYNIIQNELVEIPSYE